MAEINFTELTDEELEALVLSKNPPALDADQQAAVELTQRRHAKQRVNSAVKKYRNQSLVGFIILMIGVGGAFYDQGQERANNRHVSAQQRQAVVTSGNAVAVAGCNRDYRTALGVRRILDQSTREAVQRRLDTGSLTSQGAADILGRIPGVLAFYPLPDCRSVVHSVTSNADSSTEIPHAFYPGDKDSPNISTGPAVHGKRP